MPDPNTRAKTAVALHVDTGDGRLARRGSALLFVPRSDAARASVDALIASFVHVRDQLDDDSNDDTMAPGSNIAFDADASVEFAMIDWTALTSPGQGPWSPGSGIRVVIAGDMALRIGPAGEIVAGVDGRISDCLLDLAGAAAATFEPVRERFTPAAPAGSGWASPDRPATDLIAGTVPASAFRLELSTEANEPVPLLDMWTGSEGTVAPPSFSEVSPDDATFPPPSIVSWPDDDLSVPGDTTVGSDVNTDSTSRRQAPRQAHGTTHQIGVRIPGGAVVALGDLTVIGREPDLAVARAPAHATPIRIEAPTTVSRTHLVVSIASDGASVVVTDCGSRGRTAVLRDTGTDAEALDAWTPATAAIGDVILLGGPTEIAIVSMPVIVGPSANDPTMQPPLTQSALAPPGANQADILGTPPRLATDSTQCQT